MDAALLREKIEAFLRHAAESSVRVASIEPLSGGACQDNYKVVLDSGARWVLRSDARSSLAGSIDRAAEFEVIGTAVAAGVKTPEARWPSKGLLREGANAYFLVWRDGEAIGRRVVKAAHLAAARKGLAVELARELAKIHSIRPAAHPHLLDANRAADRSFEPAAQVLGEVRARLDKLEPSASSETIMRWLTANLPNKEDVVLVHGDFRTGNFLLTPEGLSAILDWEFAHWGSPVFDLAWMCVRDWRFGQLSLPVGGFATRDTFYAAYEAASGRTLDRRSLHFWEVFGNLAWAVGSKQQTQRYLTGQEKDLELIAIGRRAAEMEFEALRLIERGRV